MDKDIELEKIELLNGFFQTWFSMVSSIVTGGFIALLVILLEIHYQGIIDLSIFGVLTLCVLIPYSVVGMWTLNKRYNRFIEFLDDLLKKVEKGETLPSTIELKTRA